MLLVVAVIINMHINKKKKEEEGGRTQCVSYWYCTIQTAKQTMMGKFATPALPHVCNKPFHGETRVEDELYVLGNGHLASATVPPFEPRSMFLVGYKDMGPI